MSERVTRDSAMRRHTLAALMLATLAGAGYSIVTAQPRRHDAAHHERHHHHREQARRDERAPPMHDAGVAAQRMAMAAPDAVVARPDAPQRLGRVPTSSVTGQPCSALSRSDHDGKWVSRDDILPSQGFVDGDDLLTIVNRSPRFVLSPSYAPSDLVEVSTGLARPAEECVPPHRQCLRREAAGSLQRMLAAMSAAGHPGHVHSAYRSFVTQCGVFRKWSNGEGQGFCHAATSSAIAGHSQHQLGTALDLFTAEWARNSSVMRAGFGCTPGGHWIADHSWEYGFVLPYPMPLEQRAAGSACRMRDGGRDEIDPRTGYRYEPWHLRYIGVDAAGRFHRAWLASGPGGGTEIALEQWLRAERGIDGDADLPVCDGCACGLCTTFHDGAVPADAERGARAPSTPPRPTGPCGDRALVVGDDGEPVASRAPPRIDLAQARREFSGVRVIVTLSVPAHTVTQTPVTSRFSAVYASDAAYLAVPPFARPDSAPRAYPDLRGAWRLALAPRGDARWPWRAALRSTATPTWVNAANLRLPTEQGLTHVEVVVPAIGDVVRVALLRDGVVQGEVREVPVQ